MRKADNDPFGILIIDKEKGITSHDVVNIVRRMFLVKKVGHAGTLDPNATGVLVLLLGKATKLSGRFLGEDKEYEGVIRLGERTDTGDVQGTVIEKKEVNVTEEDIRKVAGEFTGEIEQGPPMFSAKRVNGKKLYKLARKGVDVDCLEVAQNACYVGVDTIDVICDSGQIRQHDCARVNGDGCPEAVE